VAERIILIVDNFGFESQELKSNGVTNLTRRFQLPYANTEYQVEVKMKSQVAKDTEEFWSPPSVHPPIRTLPKRKKNVTLSSYTPPVD